MIGHIYPTHEPLKIPDILMRSQLVQLLKYFELPLIGVELGVCGGNFSHELLSHGMEKLFSVDLWEEQQGVGDKAYPTIWHSENYEAAKKLLSEFGDKSVIIKALTTDAVHQFEDESLGLCYHDADHSYEAVSEDIKNWFPKLVKGGIFSSHDFGNVGYGVRQSTEEFCAKNNLELHFIPESSINDSGCWFRKPL